MKDKKVQEVSVPAEPMKVEIIERLVDSDKHTLELAKAKREIALEKAKSALSASEVAELAYNNIILQLALRYHLIDGDVINEDGSIKRLPR